MKKIGIVTIYDNNNYGNRLQNYAINYYFFKMGYISDTIVLEKNVKQKIARIIRESVISNIVFSFSNSKKEHKRIYNFSKFTKKYISTKYYSNINTIDENYDKFSIGSDQVWNPTFNLNQDLMLLTFTSPNKKICMSPSFGINQLPNNIDKNRLLSYFNEFNNISVREDAGKEILKDLGYKGEVAVLVDPTMLLTASEWDEVSKKPEMLKTNKYILNYFLGDLSKERMSEIQRVAKENNCEVINILDKNSPFYECGPSEFLYLEKHAFLICTDSFHSSVFAILYNRPFIIFDREDKEENMNSRLDTLISKLKLKNRKYNNKCITYENMNHDYTEAYKQLEIERKKSKEFLNNIFK